MILVVGATGNIGRPLVHRLRDRGAAVRAITRDAGRASFPEGVEVFEGDLTDPDAVRRAFTGIDKVFLLPGAGDLPFLLQAARDGGAGHAVLVTTLLAQTHPDSFIGSAAGEGERALRDSGMDWTVLRPWEFASNVLAWAPEVRERGRVRRPRSGLPSPVIDPADIAAVAACALLEPGHEGQVHALTGPQELTPFDKARALGTALGREVAFEEYDDPDAVARILKDAPDEATAGLMIPGVCALDSPGILDTVGMVTGRPARTFQEWADDSVDAFR